MGSFGLKLVKKNLKIWPKEQFINSKDFLSSFSESLQLIKTRPMSSIFQQNLTKIIKVTFLVIISCHF